MPRLRTPNPKEEVVTLTESEHPVTFAHCAFCDAATPFPGPAHKCEALTLFRERQAAWRAEQARQIDEDARAAVARHTSDAAAWRTPQQRDAEREWESRREAMLQEAEEVRRSSTYCERCERRVVDLADKLVGDDTTVARTHGMAHVCVKRLDVATEKLMAAAREQAAVPTEIAALKARLAELEAGAK